MMGKESNGLPADVRKILDAEIDAPPPPSGARGRVLSRVRESVAAGMAAGSVSGDAGVSEAGAAPLPAPASSAGIASGKIILATLAAGTTVLLVLAPPAQRTDPRPAEPARAEAGVQSPAAPIVLEDAVVPAAPDPAPSAPEPPVPVAPQTPAPAPPATAPNPEPRAPEVMEAQSPRVGPDTATPGPPPRKAADRERHLLREARAALLRGDATRGLRLLDRMARRFPQGRHVEDREALRIRALIATGQTERARQGARAFVRQYPGSIHLESVREVIGRQ